MDPTNWRRRLRDLTVGFFQVDSQFYKDAKRLEEFFDAQLLKWLPEYAYWTGEGEPPAKRVRID